MIWAVHCLDGHDSAQARQNAREAHSRRLRTAPFALLSYGPLLDVDDQPAGSLFVVESDDRWAVESFFIGDPFFTDGAWTSVSVHQFVPSNNSRVPLAAR
jgi:uncharacterized protein YciI